MGILRWYRFRASRPKLEVPIIEEDIILFNLQRELISAPISKDNYLLLRDCPLKMNTSRPKSAKSQSAPAAPRPEASARRRRPSETKLKRGPRFLRHSESFLRALINAISDPAVLLDLEGNVVLANEAFARYARMEIQNLVGQSSFSFVPPDQVRHRRAQLKEIIRSGKPQTIEESRPGHAFVVHLHPVFDEAERVAGVALVHHDVSRLRLAEETLKEREMLYRNIVESANDGVVTLKDTTITYVNPRLLAIGGYALQEVIGASILQFIHPQEIPKVLGYVAKRRSDPDSNAKYETILKAKNGQDINVEINASLLGASPGGNDILVIIRDITDRKRSERALRDAEDRYRRLVDFSVAGIYIIQNHELKFCNQKFADLFGYGKPEDIIGINFRRLVAPESWELVDRQVRLRESGQVETVQYEFKALRIDGAPFEVEVFGSRFEYQGKPAIQGTMIDITDRTMAAKKLAETNTRLQTLLQAMPDVVYFKDIHGRNLEVNKAFEDMIGLPRGQILGWTDAQLFPRDLAQQCQESDARVMQECRPVRIQEKMSFSGGTDVVYDTVKIPIRDADGRPAGLLGVSRNITEQKRAEKVQSTILHIAQAAISSDSLETFYRSVHTAIAELMPAKNFYIAVYDEASGLVTFPYFVDEFDETPDPKPLSKGLTEHVFRTGESLLATPEIFIEMEKRGEVESIGSPSIDWLGTPLKIQDRTFGVLVVQSYTEGVRYGELERDILRFVSGQVAMAIQRRQTADEISDREQFLSGVLNSIQDGITILDKDFTIMRVNRTMEQRHAAAMPLVGKKCYRAYYLRDDRCRACPTQRTLETSQAAYEIISHEGGAGVEWLDLYSFPFIDQKTGQMKGVIEYVRDITPQKLAEDKLQSSLQEKEVLLREVHHRVKNNLQVIQALISLQSRQIKDGSAVEMYKESQNRIRSMALVHERLYQSTNLSRIEFAEYLRSLVVHLFHSLLPDTSRIGLKLDLEPVELDINIAIPCGLIVNELVSNALKHAFPEPRPGEVTVSFHQREGSTLSLGVKDDGQGLPPDFDIHRSETLGMQIVITLVSQIDGRLEIGPGPGASFLVEFQESGGRTPGDRP